MTTNKKNTVFILLSAVIVMLLWLCPAKAEAASYQLLGENETAKIGKYTVKNTYSGVWSKKKNGKYQRILKAKERYGNILCNGTNIYYLHSAVWKISVSEEDQLLANPYLAKVQIDGRKNTKIKELPYSNDSIYERGLVGIYKNRIYCSFDSKSYIYHLKTEKLTKIARPMDSVKFYKNTVYFTKWHGSFEGGILRSPLRKMSLDGKNQKVIAKNVVDYKVIGRKIYYIQYLHSSEKYEAIESYCCCKLDGKSKKTLIKKVNGHIYRFNSKQIWYSYYDHQKDREVKQKKKF